MRVRRPGETGAGVVAADVVEISGGTTVLEHPVSAAVRPAAPIAAACRAVRREIC